MKTKLYSFLIVALSFFAVRAYAQCSVTMTSLVPTGLTVTGTSNGTGAAIPVYVWTWGDSQTSTTQNANHTYASAGTYTVCIGYGDASNTSCIDTACTIITVSAASGIAQNQALITDITTAPNPFVNSTNITINMNQQANVVVTVFDITGKQVATLQNGLLAGGTHIITWSPENLADGIYFLQVNTGGIVETRKIVRSSGN